MIEYVNKNGFEGKKGNTKPTSKSKHVKMLLIGINAKEENQLFREKGVALNV